jgi:uncharacterized membrane protein YkvA (DUF1232 family)
MKNGDAAQRRPALLRVAGATFQKAKQQRASLSSLWDDLMALARLVTAWARKEYTAVPWRSILMAVGALVYFLDPFDAIPDAIPGFGYVDDASVIALVAGALKTDIERFVRWERETILGNPKFEVRNSKFETNSKRQIRMIPKRMT